MGLLLSGGNGFFIVGNGGDKVLIEVCFVAVDEA